MRLILPEGKSAILAHRLAAIDPRVSIQVFELDGLSETLEKVDPCASGNIATWLVPRRESQLLLDRAAAALAPVIALAPQEITVHASTQDREVVLRFRGLPFARWNDARVFFDAGGTWEELRKQNEVESMQLVMNLQNFRNPLASETRHPLYRTQSERWLQSIVYLIAPALRFHPSTDVLLEFLRPEMEVIRIGLAESWRRGLRVMMCQ